ncbi:MAG: NYN domain-containing protein [Candidatus Omnitrophica bacterium]|jgi:predicted RNA-binding protein with PIN domain|nr:NYN domain-containing protein [Candidatus Omnitrophota bacterium]
MKTTLVVDGYNAANAIPKIRKELSKSLEAARKAVLAAAKEFARSSGFITDVRVVFDGDDRYREFDRLNIPGVSLQVFSRTGKGDDKVIETVKKCAREGRVVIASNDNYVRNNSRAYGAAVINVKELEGRKTQIRQGSGRIARTGNAKKIAPALENEITRQYMRELGISDKEGKGLKR